MDRGSRLGLTRGNPAAVENGYAVLAVNCAGEHHFTLSGSVPVHRCAANLQVRADVGRVALQKGPFVYCFEQQDNGENLGGPAHGAGCRR